jgi:hypothetical protein
MKKIAVLTSSNEPIDNLEINTAMDNILAANIFISIGRELFPKKVQE